ncbi:MAG: DUF362 domain-containing protein, partial [bacterium]|nr:DUF362 domain-containing protein [bacterium]
MKRKEVALIKETRQKEFVRKIMDTIAPYLSLKTSHKVAIKIDLSGSREIYANSHYETVESLISYLKDNFGIADISVIEGSDGAYHSGKTTWDIFYKFRYKEVELNGARLVNLDDQPHDHKMEVNTLSGIRRIRYTKPEADYVISVVPPKTHNIFPASLSIPNVLGYVKQEDRSLLLGASNSEMKKLNYSNTDRYLQLIDNSGKNLAKLLKEVTPSMALLDGLYGMEGKGPIKGSPVFHGFAVASEDIVLADALTTYIMGFEVDQISYLTYAYNDGLGNNRWQNVIGVEPPQVKFPYRPHTLFQKQKLWKDYYLRKKNPSAFPDKQGRPERQDNPDRQDKSERSGRPYKQNKQKSGRKYNKDKKPGNQDRGSRGDGNRDNSRDSYRNKSKDIRDNPRDNSRDNSKDNRYNVKDNKKDSIRDNANGNVKNTTKEINGNTREKI